MIKELNQACGKLNEKPGVSVQLPNPGKKTLKAAWNLAVGAGLAAAGLLRSSKWCAVLGGVSIISSVVLRRECDNRDHDA